VVIEHNLDLIRAADWLIDMGPEGGDAGGEIVAAGTAADLMACPASHTGKALREYESALTATLAPIVFPAAQKARAVSARGKGNICVTTRASTT
jgi:excinuclease ABC subunit A